jgi:hypothetical protein
MDVGHIMESNDKCKVCFLLLVLCFDYVLYILNVWFGAYICLSCLVEAVQA